MATRGSALQRALKYFREADVDEMRVAFTLAKEIVESRLTYQQANKPEKPKRTRTRKPKPGVEGIDRTNGGETLADA